MSARKFTHKGDDFVIEIEQLPNGKWIARINPPGGGGDWIRHPDQHATDPNTTKSGKIVEFDTEQSGYDAAKDNIKGGVY